MYNKIKDDERMSASGATLFHHLYINYNMGPLYQFDPTNAIEYWMNERKRNPIAALAGPKSRKQEYYKGVFAEAKDRTERKHIDVVKF